VAVIQDSYPFAPKSRTYLEAGQYWSIALSSGRYAAGVVVAVPDAGQAPDLPTGLKNFVAGVLDWSGDSEPVDEDLAGAELLNWGGAHVKMITLDDGLILGRVDRQLNQISMLSHRMGGTVWCYSNGVRTGPASQEQKRELPIMGVWGFRFARVLAESHFVRGLDIRARRTD